jgi:PLP dependent protein
MEGVIATNLAAVRSRIAAAATAAGRTPDSVNLVAVSKTHPAETIRDALAAGHRLFGENRVQEAQAKYPALREDFPDLALHLIGPLQTNKVRDAVALFDVIESIDRPRLAEALAKEMERSGRRLPCLIEVNTGEEPQKAGIFPAEADDFIVECRDRLGLPIEGLMCVPPLDEEPALHFALLREIARRTGMAVLSMGMSADFEKAIRFGATHVRVGSAIFGARGASQRREPIEGGPGRPVNERICNLLAPNTFSETGPLPSARCPFAEHSSCTSSRLPAITTARWPKMAGSRRRHWKRSIC